MRMQLLAVAALLALSSAVHAQPVVPISQLPAANTPLTGAEIVPCVQGGVTKGCQAAGIGKSIGYTPANASTFVAASDYGVSTASSDNSAAFNSLLAAGKVGVLAPGVYKIAATITASLPNTGLVCNSGPWAGTGNSTVYANRQSNGCWIVWTGASGGTEMTIASPLGSTSQGNLNGNVVNGIIFDGNNGLAANGLMIYSEEVGQFNNLSFVNLNGGKALSVDVVHCTNANFGDTTCVSQFNSFNNISVFENGTNDGVGIYLGDWTDPTDNYGGNASLNTFSNVVIANKTADGIECYGCDTNYFYNVRVYHSAGGNGVHFQIANVNGFTYPANGNQFYGYTGNVGAHADGKTTDPSCAAWTTNPPMTASCTTNNSFFNMDKGNNTPDPTVEAGAKVFWTNDDGTKGGVQMNGPTLGLGENYTDQLLATSPPGTACVLCIATQSTNHIVLLNGNGATEWYFNMDSGAGANANLRFITPGSGYVSFPSLVIAPTTVATLPSSPVIGQRGFVTDATACTFGSVVSGGGSIRCPVVYDGVHWFAA